MAKKLLCSSVRVTLVGIPCWMISTKCKDNDVRTCLGRSKMGVYIAAIAKDVKESTTPRG